MFLSLTRPQAGRLNKSPHTVHAISNRHKSLDALSMLYVQSPNSIDVASSAMRLFLAGSIDSGMAEDWQTSIDDIVPIAIIYVHCQNAAVIVASTIERSILNRPKT